MAEVKSKRWCFTLNNYTEEELDSISKIECEYLIYGMEIGEQGTPHLQGYVVFKSVRRFRTLKKWLPRAHFEKTIGTHKQNILYCSKEDRNPYEKGNRPFDKDKRPNAKKMLKEDRLNGQKKLATERILYGMEMEKTMMQEIFIDKLEKPKIIYIYGNTGVGKTYSALKEAIEEFGYDGVATIRFDKNGFAHCNDPQKPCLVWMEFRPSCLDAVSFLELTDGYGTHLNVKHGSMYIRPKCIYICSILPPSQIYKEEINQQFMRRITRIVDKDKDPFVNYVDDDTQTFN